MHTRTCLRLTADELRQRLLNSINCLDDQGLVHTYNFFFKENAELLEAPYEIPSPMKGQIVLAEGSVICPIYKGPVSVRIERRSYEPVLEVEHRPVVDTIKLVESKTFVAGVVRLLQRAGRLSRRATFKLGRSEMGWQTRTCASYDDILRARPRRPGVSITYDIFKEWGWRELELDDGEL